METPARPELLKAKLCLQRDDLVLVNLIEVEWRKFDISMDMQMCGGNEKIIALWLFEQFRLGISLDPQEAKWISNTMRGGLIWAIGLY
nr:5780_t:CDS:2 [Entrophospora candida]